VLPAATPPLHSSPPRRSSDLAPDRAAPPAPPDRSPGPPRPSAKAPSQVFERLARAECGCSEAALSPLCAQRGDSAASLHPHSARSEEHTPELQSRGHLVCRPL